MPDQITKAELSAIMKLNNKISPTSKTTISSVLTYQDKSGFFKSAPGLRYIKRLESLYNDTEHSDTCVLCGRFHAENQVVCNSCATQFTAAPDALVRLLSKKPKAEENTAYCDVLGYAGKAVDVFSEKINTIAGGKGAVDLSVKDLFSDVFKKHTQDEADELLVCGTSATTPPPERISTVWPKPWLYSRICLGILAPLIILQLCWSLFGNINVLPGIMFLGSFWIPVTVLFFFFEINAPRNISFIDTLRIFFFGGCGSLLVTLILYAIFPDYTYGIIGAVLIGFVEEYGKLMIVALYAKYNKKCVYILNGMLIGAAVGAGFAAFESAGYAFTFFVSSGFSYDTMLNIIYLRAFMAPGSHVAWAAITGAALMIALDRKPFYWKVLQDKKMASFFWIVVAMHAIWDMPILNTEIYLKQIILIVAAWIVVLTLLHRGLIEINRIKNVARFGT